MKHYQMFSTAALFILLGTTLPVFAQKDKEERGGGGKGQQSQHQAQPQRAQQSQHQAQPQHTQQAQPSRKQQRSVAYNHGDNGNHGNGNNGFHGNGNNGNHYGRISDDRYRASFGHDHSFRMNRPQFVGGYNRFQYGGYSFGFNAGWPVGWNYSDDMYVEYIDGNYYMYNMRHPGIHISLNLF